MVTTNESSGFGSKKARSLIEAWAGICARAGDLDFAKAKWALAVTAWVRTIKRPDATFEAFCRTILGLPAATITNLMRRAAALDLVPDERIWRAVRWSGVLRLTKIEVEEVRMAVFRVLLAERGATYFISEQRFVTILREHAPDVFCATPPVPETRKDREQRRLSEEERSGGDSEEQLKAIIRRLVEAAPILLSTLSEEERTLAGLAQAPLLATGT